MNLINKLTCLIVVVLLSCSPGLEGEITEIDELPQIYPDYTNIVIPNNIAPLNFKIDNQGEAFYLKIENSDGYEYEMTSKTGVFQIGEKDWKELLRGIKDNELIYRIYRLYDGKWEAYQSFKNTVTQEEVDPFLYYRILYPGYESWKEISIVQRSLESFKEKTVVKNTVVDENCVNCHAFNQQNSNDFMFHMRGSMGGTYFLKDGDLQKFNLKTKEMKNGAVYPRWHPSGNFVAFSSNKVVQQFHSSNAKKIEVSDLNSSLVLYDVLKNEILSIPVDTEKLFMDTYPEWSPDGKFLYFCRAKQIGKEYDYRDIKYSLYRMSFDSGIRKFSEPELVFDAEAIEKSVSFPRISPNGNSLVFTLHDYGCFSIWHKEADLYSLNLNDFSVQECEVNSEFTESYHSWSTNGSWLIFSSKRGDGLTARPYLAFIDENGKASKPFVLPQKDPMFYKESIHTFNIPEFAQADVHFNPGEIRSVADDKPIQAQWANN